MDLDTIAPVMLRRAFTSHRSSTTAPTTVTPTLLQAAKEELISSVPQRSLASALRETLPRPYAPHSATANILLNADRNSRFTHAELTKAHVRLEFSDASSPTYQALALTYLGVSEEGGDSRVRKMITDVRNHASMGAGCTVWLDRDAVTEFVMAEGDEEVTRVLERGKEVRFTVPEVFRAGLEDDWRALGER